MPSLAEGELHRERLGVVAFGAPAEGSEQEELQTQRLQRTMLFRPAPAGENGEERDGKKEGRSSITGRNAEDGKKKRLSAIQEEQEILIEDGREAEYVPLLLREDMG